MSEGRGREGEKEGEELGVHTHSIIVKVGERGCKFFSHLACALLCPTLFSVKRRAWHW